METYKQEALTKKCTQGMSMNNAHLRQQSQAHSHMQESYLPLRTLTYERRETWKLETMMKLDKQRRNNNQEVYTGDSMI